MKSEIKFYHNKEDGSYAVLLDSGALSKMDLSIVQEAELVMFSEVLEKDVPAYLRRGLCKIRSLRNRRYVLAAKNKGLLKKKEALEIKIQTIEAQMADNRNVRQKCYEVCQDISRAMSAECIRKDYLKKVTGDEVMKMSFYDKTLQRELAWAILKKTKRPIVHTHGLAYRKPTTYRKPIERAFAFEIVMQKDNLLDISFEEDCVHLNTFSSNDMW